MRGKQQRYIYMEATVDKNMNCLNLDRTRVFQHERRTEILDSLMKYNVIVTTYEYFRNELKGTNNIECSHLIVLVNEDDYMKYEREIDTSYIHYIGSSVEFIHCKRYSMKEVYEVQERFKDKHIYIVGDDRLYWSCINFVDKLIITDISKCSHNYETIKFPTIESTLWKETNGSILDDIATIVEYSRINYKGCED